jgi:enoyl-CoA hydratase/carnithine racemase
MAERVAARREGFEQISYEVKGEAALITLSRPERLNAWTPQMMEEMAGAIEAANADKSIGAIIVTGEGRGFCAGADIEGTFKTRLDGKDPGNDTAGGSGGAPATVDWIKLTRSSKPLIAAVNGPAVGIGVTMILPFDMIIASEAAKFGLVFVKMGIVPELASSHFLVSRLGWGKASEMMLTGGIYSGAEAHAMGLADHLTPPEGLMEKAFDFASRIAANPDLQLRMTKELLTLSACETDLDLVQKRETKMLHECWKTEEHAEAVAAFLEKRPAKFR